MTSFDRLARRVIRSWLSYQAARRLAKSDQRLARVIPGYSANRSRLEKAKRSHRNQQDALLDLRSAMTAALSNRGESDAQR
ncbi:hypothetical protein [Rhizobium ecuadorense]|uniref:hypothetical protein n=1 Tax=Rhizobium ecuadorense TaxID=1671795 RepID=UPI0006730F22|nr:hypothetical protein [Rhizobium ecuadorense]